LDFSERIIGVTTAAIAAKTTLVPIVACMAANTCARDVTRIFALVTAATGQADMGTGKIKI